MFWGFFTCPKPKSIFLFLTWEQNLKLKAFSVIKWILWANFGREWLPLAHKMRFWIWQWGLLLTYLSRHITHRQMLNELLHGARPFEGLGKLSVSPLWNAKMINKHSNLVTTLWHIGVQGRKVDWLVSQVGVYLEAEGSGCVASFWQVSIFSCFCRKERNLWQADLGTPPSAFFFFFLEGKISSYCLSLVLFMKFPYAYLSLDIQTLNVKYEKHLCQGTKKIFGEDLQGLLVCRTKLEKEEKL